MGLKDEAVTANEPNGEEELVDPMDTLKDRCKEDAHCSKYKDELQRCTERVESKQHTTETCAQELYDFVHCVDHCVAKDLFKHLK